MTGAAIGAAVAGTGAAIAAVAATARSAADDYASGLKQDHGSRDADMKQPLEPQPGAGTEDRPRVQYRKLETPVHDQITSRVRNSVQAEAGFRASGFRATGRPTSIEGSCVFLTSAHQASGLETATAPSSESGNPTLSPEAVTVSMSPVPFSNSSRIAGTGAGRRSKIHVLDVD